MFLHCSENPIMAQLGFRFWDPVRNTQVTDGLEVTARTENCFGRVYQAFKTPSANYVFKGLPGLHDVEYPSAEQKEPLKGKKIKLIIEVKDLQHCFLPVTFLFEEEIPLKKNGYFSNGIFAGNFLSSPPESGLPMLNLYSAPTRPIRPGMAVVRCNLKEYRNKKAATHAFIEVGIKGKRWFGMSNNQGAAAVYFPYPTVDNIYSGTSPPVRISRPLNSQKWPLMIKIYYSPDTVMNFQASNSTESGPEMFDGNSLAELGSILRQQQACIWSHATESTIGASSVSELNEELVYGQELVLRTGNESELYLELLPTSP